MSSQGWTSARWSQSSHNPGTTRGTTKVEGQDGAQLMRERPSNTASSTPPSTLWRPGGPQTTQASAQPSTGSAQPARSPLANRRYLGRSVGYYASDDQTVASQWQHLRRRTSNEESGERAPLIRRIDSEHKMPQLADRAQEQRLREVRANQGQFVSFDVSSFPDI